MASSAKTFKAKFYDGETAREHNVTLKPQENSLRISARSIRKYREWPYADIRQVHDIAEAAGTSFRVKDGLGRLNVEDPELAQTLIALSPDLNNSDITKPAKKRIVFWGAGAIVSVVLILFVIIPALANTLATMIPVEREIAMGQGTLKQVERFIGGSKRNELICKSNDGQNALDKMTARLVEHLDSPYPLDIKVYRNAIPNAFAVPGGHIVLFDGLIQNAKSPEEVAAVLGHELGHVINRDPTRLTLRSAGSFGILGMVFGDFAGGAAAMIIAEQMIAADYSQDAEADADAFAHDLLAKAELPSAPMGDFFDSLIEEFWESDGLLSHVSSHPNLADRSRRARDADTIKSGEFEPVLTKREWLALRSMCAN